MEAARHAIEAFMARNGRHDTTVHETVAPAVTHEIVTKTEYRNVTRALDREVHQDHYHISVQPITAEEHRGEQHHDEVQPVDEHSFEHDHLEETARLLEAADAEHHNTLEEVIAETTTTDLPTIEGEHIHHHVHERIQPVINKRTYETHIYHVIVPVREIHHNAARHYHSSPLPTVTLDQFMRSGGSLASREERYDAFEGEPRSVGKALGPTTKAPAPVHEPAAAPPAKASRVATFVSPVTATPQPEAELHPAPAQEPTTIASRTAMNSGTFHQPTRTPTVPANIAREPTVIPSLSRSPTGSAPESRAPSAIAPFTREPTMPVMQRESTAPASGVQEPTFAPPARSQTVPTRLSSESTQPAQLAREATIPAALAPEPTIPAPLQHEPNAPAARRESTTLAHEPTGIAPNHPLMRPPTMLPQDAYRQGPGRSAHSRPAQRHVGTRSTRARPGSTPSRAAEHAQVTETAENHSDDEPQ